MSSTTLPRPGLKRCHVLAAVMGNALEFYDFLTYAFFSIQIGHAFFPASAGAYGGLILSLAVFMAGFVTRPLGALVLGAYSDRRGRRPAMMISYTLMGASILGMALIPPYSVIGVAAPVLAVVARLAQGFSLGGEVGSNSAFLVEAASPGRRGLIVSWQGASQYIAGTAGSLAGVILTALLPPALFDAWGWRIAFLLGAATLPFGIWLRHGLPETLHAPERGVMAAAAPGEPRARLAARHWRLMTLGVVYFATSSIGTYVLTYIATYAQNTLHMKPASGLASEVVIDAVSVVVILFGGWLSDKIGRRPVVLWTNFAFLLCIWPAFAWVSGVRTDLALIVAPTILAFFSNMGAAAYYAQLGESLPKAIRGAGFAVVYSVGVAIAGGSTQLVVTWLIHLTGDPLAPAWYLMGATAIAQVALYLTKESAPVRMGALVPAPAAAA